LPGLKELKPCCKRYSSGFISEGDNFRWELKQFPYLFWNKLICRQNWWRGNWKWFYQY
jgi:hypothetical protein